jgi:DNA-binding NarL/FixJ family response regulator
MSQIDVYLVDDHKLFRNGLRLLLDGLENIKVLGEAEDGQAFLNELEGGCKPHVVLIDIDMPKMNGIEATRRALEIDPSLKLISLSMYGEDEYYYQMIEAGVKGFILKNSDISDVVKAIKTVYSGNTFFSQDILYNVVRNIKTVSRTQSQIAHLSDRELEILTQICKGLSNQEIAEKLFISKRTVDKHRANLLFKTNCKNTANLVLYAIENKLVNL